MFSAIVHACKSFYNRIKDTIKNFTSPATAVLAAGAMSDITRSRKDLIANKVERLISLACLTPVYLSSLPFSD